LPVIHIEHDGVGLSLLNVTIHAGQRFGTGGGHHEMATPVDSFAEMANRDSTFAELSNLTAGSGGP
jgi:hypothetical protein